MVRRRRPMASTPGLTRSNGRVSQAGKRSTSSGPRKARRSAASRSASVLVGMATTTGWRSVSWARPAMVKARAASGTASTAEEAPARPARAGWRRRRGGRSLRAIRRGYRGPLATPSGIWSAPGPVGEGAGVGLGLRGVAGGVELQDVADLVGHHEPEVVLADRPHQLGVDGDEPPGPARGGVPAGRPVVGELRGGAAVAGARRAAAGPPRRPRPGRRRTSPPAVPAAPALRSSEAARGPAPDRSWPGRCPGAGQATRPLRPRLPGGRSRPRARTTPAGAPRSVPASPTLALRRSLHRLVSKHDPDASRDRWDRPIPLGVTTWAGCPWSPNQALGRHRRGKR